jgi:hypothetical protein
MIAQITMGILNRLKEKGLDCREINFLDLINGSMNLVRPAVNITVQTGSFKKITLNTYKNTLDVSLIIVFNTPKAGPTGEAYRKEGVYKILEAIVNALLLQYLDLDLENPLWPVSFRNITSAVYAKAGYSLYQLMLTCSYNYDKEAEEDLGSLEKLLAQYYLEPRDYTGMIGVPGPEASDEITLTGWYGETGAPYSIP